LGRSRSSNHVAFGGGTHFCLGQPLAELEAQVAIGSLARRFTDLPIKSDRVEWAPSLCATTSLGNARATTERLRPADRDPSALSFGQQRANVRTPRGSSRTVDAENVGQLQRGHRHRA
jgi:hypothetical protein